MIMSWLGKLMGKKKTYPTDSQFKLCIVDENSTMLYQVLGITEKRCKELLKICEEGFDTQSKKTDSLQYIYKHCTHINEVVMATEMFNKMIELKEKQHIAGNLLSKLFGNG